MGYLLKPIPFPQLIDWVQNEYKNEGSVFGIRKEKFFKPSSRDFIIFVKKISNPIGPSAGPGTQLAQNILASYLAGARYIELRTVQTLDGEELRKAVLKPSINAADEGYNIEWSTELTVEQAMEEYIKAWFLCHICAVEFDISEENDFIFNLSIGYTLDGIKSEKIDSFIEGLKNAKNTAIWERCYSYMAANISSFSKFTKADLDAISPEIAKGITISTFYNCPRDEIEKIAAYFLSEKGLNTFIKLNPTLLGSETTRALLDTMGYNHILLRDFHFKNDLHFNDAVKILRGLKALASRLRLGFGVKLTNTLPVETKQNELPGNEMYMSGRALFPLSLYTVKKLVDVFHNDLLISYSGGVDYFNLKAILAAGIRPVTMTTNILKPGGAERFTQLAQIAAQAGADNAPNDKGINIKALGALCEEVKWNSRHYKDFRRASSRKMTDALPLFDCSTPLKTNAPCKRGCPLRVKIPQMLSAQAQAQAQADYSGAFKIIALDNAAPSVTCALCYGSCQGNCTRLDYEDPLQIKNAELLAAQNAQEAYTSAISASEVKTNESVAVIGAGVAGISAAVFLRRNGVPVTVYEKRSRPFGMIQHAIPSSKISDEAINRDYMLAVNTGVEFVFNAPENFSLTELKKKHRFVVIATGAWKEGEPVVKQGQENILNALKFLEDVKESNYGLNIGKKIAVIGTGGMAIDCAVAAKRCKGVDSVTVIYGHSGEFFPTTTEKITIRELSSPENWNNGILTCEEMTGDNDFSGKRVFKPTGKKQDLRFDTVISAADPKVDDSFFTANSIHFADNLPKTGANLESSLSDVYIAGSCRTGVLSTIFAAEDGKAAAEDILRKLNINADFSEEEKNEKELTANLYQKKGVILEARNDNTDAERCLSCNALCEICVDVCPNRANVSVALKADKTQIRQIVHIDSMCNDCGNCAVFCPYTGRPYKDKPVIFYNEEDFTDSESAGILKTGEDAYTVRLENKSIVKYRAGGKKLPRGWAALLDAITARYGYLFNA